MRAREITSPAVNTYLVRLRLPQVGYSQQMDTTVQARNPEQARRLVRAQYGARAAIIGQPRLIT